MKHISKQKGKELVDAVHKAIAAANTNKEEAVEELLHAAKFCHQMEYFLYLEKNIPTSLWMANLANAIEKYEKLK